MRGVNLEQSLKIREIGTQSAKGGRLPVDPVINSSIGFIKPAAGWLLTGLLTLLLIFPALASATSPSDLKLSYLEAEQALQVTITHRSISPNYHYIQRVEVQKNSERPAVNEYSSQPDKSTFTYTYKLPLRKGDRVSVKASCSLYGSKTAEIVLGEPAGK